MKLYNCCSCSTGASGGRKLITSLYTEPMHSSSSSTQCSVKTGPNLCFGGKSLANRGLFDLGAENQRCSGGSRSRRDRSCPVRWVRDVPEIEVLDRGPRLTGFAFKRRYCSSPRDEQRPGRGIGRVSLPPRGIDRNTQSRSGSLPGSRACA